jgi:hypothetical protein|tara:strand:+ start:5251 stop:5490 length:240 start_codon:yes stop_codon:yes gene_type:complete
MLGNLIGGFIVITIGVNLIPALANSIIDARFHNGSGVDPTNVTGVSSTLINLSTLFFALGIMASGVSLAVNGLRNSGLI